ncbi:hypothetical protein QLX08_002406 [Tetragonisca angustula]|uniref:Uncharacterized protein n=1 Tax=Tetragonisca angustula TaxID=166442 RepID=A0AAW1ABV1_9HYME
MGAVPAPSAKAASASPAPASKHHLRLPESPNSRRASSTFLALRHRRSRLRSIHRRKDSTARSPDVENFPIVSSTLGIDKNSLQLQSTPVSLTGVRKFNPYSWQTTTKSPTVQLQQMPRKSSLS